MNFELSGVMEHKVQSNAQFKLLVTQGGSPVDCNLPVKGWLKGLRDTVVASVTRRTGEVVLTFCPGVIGIYELHIDVGEHHLYKGDDVIVKIVEQFSKVVTEIRYEVTGPGLNGGIVGKETDVTIYVKDQAGDAVDINHSDLALRVGSGANLQSIRPVRVAKGHYTAPFTVPLPGFFAIDLFYDGKSVLLKPENVQFVALADPSQTRAVQVPQSMVAVGNNVSFIIQARNRNGLNNNTGGDEFNVACTGPVELSDLVVKDLQNGKYQVSFTPPATGIYELDIELRTVEGRAPISNSPVKISATRK